MEEEELDADVDFDKLESILDILLSALKQQDTGIRIYAAQALGKITGRLTLDMADEIVEQIFEMFSDNEGDETWQGACLAIAELS